MARKATPKYASEHNLALQLFQGWVTPLDEQKWVDDAVARDTYDRAELERLRHLQDPEQHPRAAKTPALWAHNHDLNAEPVRAPFGPTLKAGYPVNCVECRDYYRHNSVAHCLPLEQPARGYVWDALSAAGYDLQSLQRVRADARDKVLAPCDAGHEVERTIAALIQNPSCPACTAAKQANVNAQKMRGTGTQRERSAAPDVRETLTQAPVTLTTFTIAEASGHEIWVSDVDLAEDGTTAQVTYDVHCLHSTCSKEAEGKTATVDVGELDLSARTRAPRVDNTTARDAGLGHSTKTPHAQVMVTCVECGHTHCVPRRVVLADASYALCVRCTPEAKIYWGDERWWASMSSQRTYPGRPVTSRTKGQDGSTTHISDQPVVEQAKPKPPMDDWTASLISVHRD